MLCVRHSDWCAAETTDCLIHSLRTLHGQVQVGLASKTRGHTAVSVSQGTTLS